MLAEQQNIYLYLYLSTQWDEMELNGQSHYRLNSTWNRVIKPDRLPHCVYSNRERSHSYQEVNPSQYTKQNYNKSVSLCTALLSVLTKYQTALKLNFNIGLVKVHQWFHSEIKKKEITLQFWEETHQLKIGKQMHRNYTQDK
jgi:hypothetical protein